MELIPIQSTNLSRIGYDPDSMLMQIQFRSGGLYSYANIEPDTYSAMMNSGDPGEYFATIIKPQRQRYPFTRMI